MHHQSPSTSQILYLDPKEMADLESFNDVDLFNRSDMDDLNGFNSQEIDGGMIGMSALDCANPSLDLPDMQWSMVDDASPFQPSQAPLTMNNDFFSVTPDAFSDLVHDWAEADKRARPLKQKRRDAAIDLHLQRLHLAYYGSGIFDASPHDDGVSSTTYYTPNSSLDGVSSLSRTASTSSVSPPARSSAESTSRPSHPPGGGVEMILDLNMNAATKLPRKQKKRTPAQIEDYRTVRRNGACAKHKQQHKKCNCHGKTASETVKSAIKKTITSKRIPCTEGQGQKKLACNRRDHTASEPVKAASKKTTSKPAAPIPQPNPPPMQLLDPLVVPPETTPAVGEFFMPLEDLFGADSFSFGATHSSLDAYLPQSQSASYLPAASTVMPRPQQLHHLHVGRAAVPAQRVPQPSPNWHESWASASNLTQALPNETSVGPRATVLSDGRLATRTGPLGQNSAAAPRAQQAHGASITAECNPVSYTLCPMQAEQQLLHSKSMANLSPGAVQAVVVPEPTEQTSQTLSTAIRATIAAIIHMAVLAWCCCLWMATAMQSFGLNCLAQIPCVLRRRRVLIVRPPVVLGLS